MAAKSSETQYGTVIVTIHWVTAILIAVALAAGFAAGNASAAAEKAAMLRIHIPAAIAVLLLTLFRIVWWWKVDRKPKPVPSMPGWQDRAARGVHLLFYIVILGLTASGLGMMALSGGFPAVFGDAAMPVFTDYPPRTPHGFGGRALAILIFVHVGAALFHQFVRRDGTLGRMWLSK